MRTTNLNILSQLARLYNVQTAYYDVTRKRRQASVESLLAILRALGAPVASPDDVTETWRERRQYLLRRVLEPVTIAWNGEIPLIKVCVPENLPAASWRGYLEMEDNRRKTWTWRPVDLPVLDSIETEGKRYLIKGIALPENLPLGYHRFSLEIQEDTVETLIIAAPLKTYAPSESTGNRTWGTFLPLYAMHTGRNIGSGDYTGLASLTDFVAGMGGNVVATLPLLPTFLNEPFEPSPYAPVSRLMWNEFYIDIAAVPELAECPQAREILQSPRFEAEKRELQKNRMVEYRRTMSLKRSVIQEFARCLLAGTPDCSEDFRRFIRANPRVNDYAGFRAVMEKQGSPWSSWPQCLFDGKVNEDDYDKDIKNYYACAQWLAHRQVQALADNARSLDLTLYFDLPVGAHPDGYDVWRERDNFALEATAGAPPDAVFTGGQNWVFPPLHPERIRENGYKYIRDYLRHHLQHCGMLRIDHVMGVHRLFWIPEGLDAGQGVYVHYNAEELYAILALESHRYKSVIVGEDLGMVPAYVRPAMSRHGLHRMYILHYELADNAAHGLHRPRQNIVASLNTHDMPPFAAFWEGLDIEERKDLGLLDEKGVEQEKRTRRSCKNSLIQFLRRKKLLAGGNIRTRDVFKACLRFLSASRARTVLVNLEDLWMETQSQNVPGTDDRRANWRYMTRYTFEEFCRLPEVRDTLEEVNKLRKLTGK